GDLDARLHAAGAQAHRGPCHRLRHQEQDHRRQRSGDLLPRDQGGDGLRAQGAQALPPRGERGPPLRPLLRRRRQPPRGGGRLHRQHGGDAPGERDPHARRDGCRPREVGQGDGGPRPQGPRGAPAEARGRLEPHLLGRELTMANMAQAIRMALHYGEENLGITDIFGEDVGPPLGGVFTATQGLRTAWNTPLDERGIIGMAIGLAMAGQRPVAEIQFADYIYNTIDLLKLAGNTCWSSNGDWNLPMVVMTPVGAGIRGSIYHSHSFDAVMSHIPGWKIVMPATPLDAYGLMLSAIKDPNPVMFLPPKALMRHRGEELIPGEPEDPRELSKMIDAPVGDRSKWKPTWPPVEEYVVPIGKAKLVRPGSQLTVAARGRCVPLALQAAKQLE